MGEPEARHEKYAPIAPIKAGYFGYLRGEPESPSGEQARAGAVTNPNSPEKRAGRERDQIIPVAAKGKTPVDTIAKQQRQYRNLRIAIEDALRPEVRAILDTIAFAEGTEKHGYYTAFGGGRLADLRKFPVRNGTTASGRYQINKMTYNGIADTFGSTDFSRFTQDMMATYKLQHTKVLDALLAGDLDTALSRATRTWASIPKMKGGESKYRYGGKAQPSKSYEVLKALYVTRLEVYRARERDNPYKTTFQGE